MTMRIIDSSRRQQAVYWEPKGVDDFGQPTYKDPIQIRVRWEDITEMYITVAGETRASRSKVSPGQDLVLDGVLWLGTLDQIPQENLRHPFANKDAFPIKRFDKIPTLNAKQIYRVAYL